MAQRSKSAVPCVRTPWSGRRDGLGQRRYARAPEFSVNSGAGCPTDSTPCAPPGSRSTAAASWSAAGRTVRRTREQVERQQRPHGTDHPPPGAVADRRPEAGREGLVVRAHRPHVVRRYERDDGRPPEERLPLHESWSSNTSSCGPHCSGSRSTRWLISSSHGTYAFS